MNRLLWIFRGPRTARAFASCLLRLTSNTGLYQLSLDAPSPKLIAEVKRGARVVWSPDGSRALVSTLATSHYISPYDDGEELLYTIAADGSDKRVLVRYSSNRPVAGYGE